MRVAYTEQETLYVAQVTTLTHSRPAPLYPSLSVYVLNTFPIKYIEIYECFGEGLDFSA